MVITVKPVCREVTLGMVFASTGWLQASVSPGRKRSPASREWMSFEIPSLYMMDRSSRLSEWQRRIHPGSCPPGMACISRTASARRSDFNQSERVSLDASRSVARSVLILNYHCFLIRSVVGYPVVPVRMACFIAHALNCLQRLYFVVALQPYVAPSDKVDQLFSR